MGSSTSHLDRTIDPALDDLATLFAGSGEMEARMRAKSWADTSLGPTEAWPQSLKTIIRMLLTSRFAMWIGWGDDLSFFYNNAYRPTLGIKHEWALGASAREVWKEIWPDIGPRIQHVLNTGEATWDEALPLFVERHGYVEETYHTFSYSPLADDKGTTVGMLCVVTEETERVIGERRLASLSGLASDIAGTNTRVELFAAIHRQVGANTKDLPFTLTYLFDEKGTANLACVTGVEPGHSIAPIVVDPVCAHPTWPTNNLLTDRTMLTVGDLQRFGPVPTGNWEIPPREVVIAPIARQGQEIPAGFFVAALNPYRPSSETNLRFISLVAGQLAAGLANADAYEEAQRRTEELAELDRAKTAFFSNVSHEFRTPLTLLLGPLEELMAATDIDRGVSQPLIAIAHRNALRLLKLVNSLLNFSRIEAGRMQANYQPTELAAVTAELASGFRSAIDMAGLRLIVDCPRLPHPVHVDRDMWETIVLNLLSNAFKFTFDGEIEVAVKATADGKAVELSVRDTGTGIPAQELPRLFDRFHRIDGAHGRTFEGSGIGLALVQELARLQGGKVSVQSELGHGSAFIVTVPFGTSHLSKDRIASEPVSISAGSRTQAYVEEALRWLPDRDDTRSMPTPTRSDHDHHDHLGAPHPLASTRGGRVLLADDNADMREYVRRLLAGQGYVVETAPDGAAALAAARRQRPDLILSDVMMPSLDGYSMVQALRDDPDTRDVPVVLLSARAGEEALVAGMQAGADDYLTKPFSARELLARVAANIRTARVRRDAADALRSRTLELETVLATVPAAVWFTYDLDGRNISGNRQAAAWLRLPERANLSIVAQAQERPHYRVFRDGCEAASDTLGIRRALLGEDVRDDEVDIRFEDGTSLTLLTQATPLRDLAGGVVGAVCAGIDISSRKRSEERCRRVVESAPSAMVMVRPSGHIEMVNTQAERVFGYPRHELLGQPVEILLPERFRRNHPTLRTDFFADTVARAMGEGRDLSGRKKDGSEFPIEIGLSPIETDEGIMVLSAIVDLSDRVRAAQELAHAEAEFRASFEGAAVGKILADPLTGRILRANRPLARLLGREPDELVGLTCRDFTWHEDPALDTADYARLLSGDDEVVVRELRYIRRDGSPFWVRASATVVQSVTSHGRAIVVGAVEDIETRYKAETALKIAKQELEQVVKQRTEALNQRDLLLREVYHRVKNNLQLVDGLLMMQGRKIDDPQAKQALLGVRGRISALGLVHQQLMGSSDLKTFDVVHFLDELSSNIMESGGTGGVTISVAACALDIGLDFAVPLGLLVTELVTNSLKHAFPQGTGTISVILRNDGRGNLALIVADNGIGPASLDPASGVITEESRSGLGTRIISRLVHQLEGTIEVRNENGTTTEIRIAMPVQE
jgi:PAS domain S-box-containing protein